MHIVNFYRTIGRSIDEFFPMRKGELIASPYEEIILLANIKMRRIGLKHIVESRKEDGYSSEEIKNMLPRIPEVLGHPEVDVVNKNKRYPDSRIAGKAYVVEKRALLVLYQKQGQIKTIYNLYFRDIKRFQKMK